MLLPQLFFRVAESGANHFIALDPDSHLRLESIQGSIINIEVQGLMLHMYVLVHAADIELMSTFEGEIDTTISGTPLDLIALVKGEDDLFSSRVNISGDLDVAKKFSRFLKAVNIDWEEHISTIVGDSLAYQLGNVFRQADTYVKNTAQSIRGDVSEYLVDETRNVAVKSEVNHFISDVDDLKATVDRMEKRINLLDCSKGNFS